MRIILTTLMASVAALAFSAAQAADAVDQIPEAPQASYEEPVATGNWAGAYAGGAASYNFGRFSGGSDFDNKALGGSVYGGYNMQNGQIVYGAEADAGYSGNDSVSGGVTTKQGINGSLRGRVGYDANPFLIYGTAGVAAARITAEDATSEKTRGALGWTAGAGVETFVTDSITARAEYRYTDLQSKDYALTSGTVNRGYDEHSVKVGLGVKF